MNHEVLIYNKSDKKIPRKFIKNSILLAMDFLKLKQPSSLAVLVVSSEEIKEFNRRWRNKNKVVDELSFGLNSRQNGNVGDWQSGFAKKYDKMLELGEILINADKIANKNCLLMILIHSLLHLLGHNHEKSKKKAVIMERLEERILKKILRRSIFS